VQRLVDRVAAIFVPIVLAVALASFFGWWLVFGNFMVGVIAAVSVLVIACPLRSRPGHADRADGRHRCRCQGWHSHP
jgi:hypothetical protein